MICRHGPGDPNCSSTNPTRYYESEPKTPDKKNYEIVDFRRVGEHIVLKVLYPNCKSCAYEGRKVMVFLNVAEADILLWKEIDPHFRAPQSLRAPSWDRKAAPSPAARFPASDEGWKDAIAYAQSKK